MPSVVSYMVVLEIITKFGYMNIQAEKLNVLQKIINSDDVGLIKDIKSLISNRELDWFDNLSKNQQADVKEGLAQLDNGQSFSHEDAKKRFGFK
jgi:hypothetical protein